MQIDIIRAWKDEDYRNSLTEEQRRELPENPVGEAELNEIELALAAGGRPAAWFTKAPVCGGSGACTGWICG